MSNHPVPAAAEGSPDYEKAFVEIEMPISNLEGFSRLALHVVDGMFMKAEETPTGTYFRVSDYEKELLLFVLFRLADAADQLDKQWTVTHQVACAFERRAAQ